MTQEHPLVTRYLARLREGVTALSAAEQDEILQDIRTHITEAVGRGTPLDAVLAALGPADVLARAYAVELLLNPVPGRSATPFAHRFFALAGILVMTGIPTLVVVSVLGSVGLSLLFAGVVVFLAGLADAFEIALPFVQGPISPLHPAALVALGPAMSFVGVASLAALYYYLRWLGRTISAALPTRR